MKFSFKAPTNTVTSLTKLQLFVSVCPKTAGQYRELRVKTENGGDRNTCTHPVPAGAAVRKMILILP